VSYLLVKRSNPSFRQFPLLIVDAHSLIDLFLSRLTTLPGEAGLIVRARIPIIFVSEVLGSGLVSMARGWANGRVVGRWLSGHIEGCVDDDES